MPAESIDPFSTTTGERGLALLAVLPLLVLLPFLPVLEALVFRRILGHVPEALVFLVVGEFLLLGGRGRRCCAGSRGRLIGPGGLSAARIAVDQRRLGGIVREDAEDVGYPSRASTRAE